MVKIRYNYVYVFSRYYHIFGRFKKEVKRITDNMKVKNILLDDWSEYDNRKLRNNKEVYFVDFNHEWEVEYIIEKIKKFDPYMSNGQILDAITACYLKLSNPINRKQCLEYIIPILEKSNTSKTIKSKSRA